MNRKLENSELPRKSQEEFKQAEKIPLMLVLDNVRSLHNVGSVFRTADSFLIEGIILCGITGQPPNKEIQKTALGATSTVNWQYFSNTMDAVAWLRENGYLVYAVEQTNFSIALQDFQVPSDRPVALVLGNEIDGVQQQVVDSCDGVIEIPQSGFKHSLNIAVAAGIVVWEIYKNYTNHKHF